MGLSRSVAVHVMVLISFASCASDLPSLDSREAIAAAISRPTGRLTNAERVRRIADALAHSSARALHAELVGLPQKGTEKNVECPQGGSLTVSRFDRPGPDRTFETTLDGCCWTDACCHDGRGTEFFAPDFSQECAAWELTGECYGTPAPATWGSCVDANESWTLLTVQGKTFAVGGVYSPELDRSAFDVRDRDTTWRCRVIEGDRTCETDGGDTIDW